MHPVTELTLDHTELIQAGLEVNLEEKNPGDKKHLNHCQNPDNDREDLNLSRGEDSTTALGRKRAFSTKEYGISLLSESCGEPLVLQDRFLREKERREHSQLGLLGAAAAVVLAAAAAVTGDGAVVLGVAEELLEGVLGVVEDGGLDRDVFFSVGFASAT